MANNRMFLMHRPSKKMFCIGKRMAVGWYILDNPGFSRRFNKWLNATSNHPETNESNQDDFILVMENEEERDKFKELLIPEWQYGVNGAEIMETEL